MTASIKSSADGTQAIIGVGGVDRLAIDATTSLSSKNRIINGNFGINQRGVSGTVTLGAGVYGHDRWKAGASGCTYTFSTTSNITTITITAGSLMQVIEGLNLFSGTHILSWTGTAQGRVDSGTYATTGVQGTAVGGTNQTIEFGTGTVSKVQYESGTVATPFENRPIGTELALCQRYYENAPFALAESVSTNGGTPGFYIYNKEVKRATPSSVVEVNSASGGVSSVALTGFPEGTVAVVSINSTSWYRQGYLQVNAEL